MAIRKRESKKAKGGYVYEAYFYHVKDGIRKRISKSGFKTKKEAQEYIALKQAELHETGNIAKECKKTFEDVYYEFLELGCDKYQHNTIYNTKNVFNTYIIRDLGKYPVTHLNYVILQKYFNLLSVDGLERNKCIRKAIKRVLDFAIKMGYIQTNPINLVTVKGTIHESHENKVISISDFNRIIEALNKRKEYKYKVYSIALQIGLYTGLRISEVLALEKEDIDFEQNLIFVNKKLNYQGLKKTEFYTSKDMKSKTSNAYIPLANKLKDILIEWFQQNTNNRVICDKDGYYINPNIFGMDMKEIYKDLGINLHFHLLRHSFCSMLVTNNINIKTAQELMRHSNINTTLSLYTHINNEIKKNAVNEIFK